MTSTGLSPRPRQLVLAAGMVVAGSGFLVLAILDSLSTLNSLDVRDQLQALVTSSTGRSMGLGVDQLISALRVVLSVTAVCAAVALVLGVFVLQRHRGARIGLSVLAVPLLITSPIVGGFLGALVAAATVSLWTGACRDWYDGKPIRQPVPRTRRDPDRPPTGPPPPTGRSGGLPVVDDPPSTATTSAAPRATQGYGAPVRPPVSWPPPYAEQAPAPEPGQAWPLLPPRSADSGADPGADTGVPAPVRVACVLTWVFAGIVALLYVIAMGMLVADKSLILDRVVSTPQWQRAGIGRGAVEPLLWAGIGFFVVWSVAAMVLAWFTWRRHNWARWLLGASTLLTLLSLTLVFPVGAAHQLACAATLGLLFGPRARLWFDRSPTSPRPPPPPPSAGPW